MESGGSLGWITAESGDRPSRFRCLTRSIRRSEWSGATWIGFVGRCLHLDVFVRRR